MRRDVFRIAVLVIALLYVGLAIYNFHAAWLLAHPTPENLARGVRWHPRNPELWTRYAQSWLFSDPAKAADAFQRAAALNPMDTGNWDGLAAAYLQLGDAGKAEAAMRARLVAAPHSPQAAWQLANLLLFQGREEEAFPLLRVAAASDSAMRPPVFEVAWKIAPAAAILAEIVPPEPEARRDYLHFLIDRRKLSEAYEVWQKIRKTGPEAVKSGNAYVMALADAGRGRDAARVWEQILEDTNREAAKPRGELVTNGDFELDLLNAGLDWRLAAGPGYQIALDNFVLQHGSRSLRVAFDGSANPEFRAVSQLVPVEPNRDYRFRGYIKTENITTDNGLRFCVSAYAAPPKESFEHCSENRVGDNPWLLEQIDFRTGPGTQVVSVALNRQYSKKFNNLLQGKVWMDALSIQPRPQ